MKPKILIVDNNKMHRKAMRDMQAGDPNIGILAEAGDGVEALARASETAPDVVRMDITMPRMNGIEATRQMVAVHPGVKVIALSTLLIKEYILEMPKVGAIGYISTDEVGEHLLSSIRAALKQQTHLCPLAAAAVADTLNAYA
jgi:DNA-binding NarL/FixJ family response regulator